MKTYKISILFLVVFFVFSCSDDEANMMIEKVSCTENVSFEEDGTPISMIICGVNGSTNVSLNLDDPNSNSIPGDSKTLSMKF